MRFRPVIHPRGAPSAAFLLGLPGVARLQAYNRVGIKPLGVHVIIITHYFPG